MKPTVYLETTVVSYYIAKPHQNPAIALRQEITKEWWRTVLTKLEPFVSPTVLDEISHGDEVASQERLDTVATFTILKSSPQVISLAKEYRVRSQIPEKSRADAFHLAFASSHGMDYLVSWNCKHIVSGRVKRILDEINHAHGIRTPSICTPEELMEI
jgi:predicted nucleic acid-binding protein